MRKFKIGKEYIMVCICFLLLLNINIIFYYNLEAVINVELTRMMTLLHVSNFLFIVFLVGSFIMLLRYIDVGKKAHELTRLMLDLVPMACSIRDKNNNILDFNQEMLRLFGFTDKSELFRQVKNLNPEFQRDGSLSSERISQYIASVFEKGAQNFEWVYKDFKGGLIPVETILVKVPWEKDDRFACYSRDMREVREKERQIREADSLNREMEIQTRSAQVANEAKSRFLASMSHEIRTPMNAIIGMSDLMRTDNLDETQEAYLDDIKRMSRSLLQIINDILDFSKIEAGKFELLPIDFSMDEMFDHIVSMSNFSATVKELAFNAKMADDVPKVIFGDDARIRQIIVNIINNAIKYTKEGSIDFNVFLLNPNAYKKSKDSNAVNVAFTIKDTGIGIRQEDMPKLFDTFARMDNYANRGIRGTGLGLSICKQLVEMMGGEISIKSEYGKGSEFTVVLPLLKGNSSRIEHNEVTMFVNANNDVKALVVDDNNINLKVAVAYLARHHINADTAQDGLQAIEMIKETAYDIVYMDHMMPEIDGIEATKRIRVLDGERFKTLPIIALSANAVSGAKEEFLKAGMNDFISKPIDPMLLNKSLLRWLPANKIDILRLEKQPAAVAASGKSSANQMALNRELGIQYSCGDEDLYNKLLRSFLREYREAVSRITTAFDNNDSPLALRIAHTLKSTAAQIGAGELSKAAAAMEKTISETNKYNEDEMKNFDTALKAVLAEMDDIEVLNPAAGKPVTENSVAEDSDAKNFDMEKAADFINELLPLLETGNTKCMEYTGQIREILSPVFSEANAIAIEIEDFHFSKAAQLLADIKNNVNQKR